MRSELLASAGIADQSEDAWQTFILDGDAYRAHIGADDYPHDGDSCLYCRQPIAPEALALVKRYREFAADAARGRIDAARAQTTSLSRHLTALSIPSLRSAVKQLREDNIEDQYLAAVEAFLVKLDAQRSAHGARS